MSNIDDLTIDKIIYALNLHFNYNYQTHNGAKLPVLAFYAIYSLIIKEFQRYKDCNLMDLASLTQCDLTSKSGGDIEIYKNDKLFEAVEIKLNRDIDYNIVSVVENKIYKHNPERYYILSSSGVNEEERRDIETIVKRVKESHGCLIIINGLLATIKYYLRLISSLEDFIKSYSSLIEQDKEIMKIHKTYWDEIVKTVLNKEC